MIPKQNENRRVLLSIQIVVIPKNKKIYFIIDLKVLDLTIRNVDDTYS